MELCQEHQVWLQEFDIFAKRILVVIVDTGESISIGHVYNPINIAKQFAAESSDNAACLLHYNTSPGAAEAVLIYTSARPTNHCATHAEVCLKPLITARLPACIPVGKLHVLGHVSVQSHLLRTLSAFLGAQL